MNNDWKPGASSDVLHHRAQLLRIMRDFFAGRSVLEVSTPVLGRHGASDLHLVNVVVTDGSSRLYLQTSPEYAMKRLVAAGSGPIFQICPAFRGRESGRRHNLEFTMLEWYRPGYRLEELALELTDLLDAVFEAFGFNHGTVARASYRALFESRFGVNPHQASAVQLKELAESEFPGHTAHIIDYGDMGSVNDYLDLLFSMGVEPGLVDPVVVFDYPASQAALATIADVGGEPVARRFEFVWQGVELANGYDELRDAGELSKRFVANNEGRKTRGMPIIEADTRLLAALDALPACAGVAVGVDRLLMLVLGKDTIDEVLSFSDQRI
ncbi:MAG: EF-P lysine aminoacylase EpmA [Pseudomonadales bacterium]